MRISNILPFIVVSGVGFAAAQTLPFEGTFTTVQLKEPMQSITMEDLRAGAQVFKFGDKAKAVQGLFEAAEKGNAFALWRLGRMYADGDGVEQNKLKAFELFSRCADDHAFDGPDMPQSHFVANAYVALGRYYLEGIPDTHVKSDPERARDMFAYAASYFGDSDAQYQLGRLFFEGKGVVRPRASRPIRGRRCAGSRSPPTRASTRRRRCSARSCSAATASRASGRSA